MRKFRHKTSGITAILNEDGHYHFIRETKDVVCQEHIHKSFIENSNDWEEILVENTFSRNIFKPKEEPNYLITAFESNKNNAIYKINSSGKYEHQNKNSYNADRLIELGFIIISVKNHIGIEYKIGDKFKSPLSENKFKIAGFTIKNDIMYVCTECNYKFNINDLDNIILSTEVKSPIYTTTDGVDVQEGEGRWLWLLSKDLLNKKEQCIFCFSKQDKEVADRYLTFTSEENRDKYIKENTKKPIFVSEDGKEMFEGDEYYIPQVDFNDNLTGTFLKRTVLNKQYFESMVRFSSPELAQEYIDNNKPKYSLADIEKCYFEGRSCIGFIEELKKLGK